MHEECAKYIACEELSPSIAKNRPVFHGKYAENLAAGLQWTERRCLELEGLGFQTLRLPLVLDYAFRIT